MIIKRNDNFTNDTPQDLTMGQKLKMFRELNNLSQEQLGQKLNVEEKTISAWETDKIEINLNNAKLICAFFNIPNSYFVFNENFHSIDMPLQDQIRGYIANAEFKNKIEKIIDTCKQKIVNDGIPNKKDYLPVFDYNNNHFISYGLFDEKKLPIKSSTNCTIREVGNNCDITIDDNNLENKDCYVYSSAKLTEYGLFDILQKFNNDNVEIIDLINCDNIDIFKRTLRNMKNKKYKSKNIRNPFGADKDISKEYIQKQLNDTLENLNPNLSKFWEIIVFLIDNGAYYIKQTGWGSDVVCWKNEEDISKTNLVYRIAKDKIKN